MGQVRMSACQDRHLYGLNHLHYLTMRRHAAVTRAGRRSKMSGVPQQRHFYGLNHLHYITTSTYRRARVFDSERFKRRFVSTWAELRASSDSGSWAMSSCRSTFTFCSGPPS